KNTAATKIAQAITKALTKADIKATAEGALTLDPAATVKLAPGAEVALKPHQTVSIAPDSKVTVALPTGSPAFVPSPQQLQENEAEGIERITTTFTIFKSQPYRKGRVVTVWEFKTDRPNIPYNQVCHYKENMDTSAEILIDIAEDVVVKPQIPNRLNINFQEAAKNCIWNNV
ncbi:hypothetical protein AB4156_41970, partial [Cupriavidus sp. 2MCAB6]|uniref:hypothetical protein n=1 Tax=Cupriavidus sp. 2MCAB6 TaxID=3232981 RepID=UPI003F909BED